MVHTACRSLWCDFAASWQDQQCRGSRAGLIQALQPAKASEMVGEVLHRLETGRKNPVSGTTRSAQRNRFGDRRTRSFPQTQASPGPRERLAMAPASQLRALPENHAEAHLEGAHHWVCAG